MTDVKVQLPTLFRVVTSRDELDHAKDSKLQYLVHADYRGQPTTKQRVLKDFITILLESVVNNDRFFGGFRYGDCLKWRNGIKQIERDELYDESVNLVSLHQGLGPACQSHVVREGIHVINLISIVTVVEHLVRYLGSDRFRDAMEQHQKHVWVMAAVDDALQYALQSLLRDRMISARNVINAYEYNRRDDGMSLVIGGLFVVVKVDQYMQVSVTYDQRTRTMVKDNYGDDFIYD